MQMRELACELNRASVDFDVGGLQEERKRRLSLKRRPCRGIFSNRSIHDGYAFHGGGRTELQFNIGEDCGAIRHGVAFSLQPSGALPSIARLRPKIKRFNDYVRSHAEDFAGFDMWHWWTPEQKRTRKQKEAMTARSTGMLLIAVSNHVGLVVEQRLHPFPSRAADSYRV